VGQEKPQMEVAEPQLVVDTRQLRAGWLPHFVNARALLGLLVFGQLLAVVSVVAPNGLGREFWLRIGPVSLLVHWISLCCALSLTAARARLTQLPTNIAGTLALLIVAIVSTACAWFAYHASALLEPNEVRDDAWAFAFRIALLCVLVAAALLRYLYVQHQWVQQIQLNARTKIEALTARIRPHFLFNSMNTVASLIAVDPARAEKVVEDLSDLFRAALRAGEQPITLKDELALAKQYLDIEQTRLGERLRVQWDCDASVDEVSIPALLLQPLVENAVYHGIQQLEHGGLLRIKTIGSDQRVRIEIINPMPPIEHPEHRGNRVALSNIRERLALAYGATAWLQIEKIANEYWVTLELPRDARLSSSA
jgi:two-component system, LytTR family, sensor histidine kinase AlgZ